ncbi:DUF4124 domain-containing protein [Imhoffiella purpurea]|uniref:DUF4124 domain-containing protein n=1 Tax=Imhoffiella purpurea TaxID=1249627 RepID=W9VJI6_9GAMM|nr:DUF4124 domain-containing protein [Imhoffiella purpurea]EXJ17171.1 hypothetical protein D779_0923 [Imhoffiella purpurea]
MRSENARQSNSLIEPLRKPWLLATLVSVCCSSLGLAQPLYRWVDENGEVHYTDSVPATESKQGHTRLSDQGLHTEVVPPAPTEAELEKAKELERIKEEEERRIAEQKAADQRLLDRYRTAEELELTREGKIAGVDSLIQVKRDLIRANLTRRQKLEMQKREALESGKPVPSQITADIDNTDAQIRANYAAIVDMEYQKTAIRREFSELLEHYRRLRNLAAPQDSEPLDTGTVGGVKNLVSCKGIAECTRYWERALAYVRAHSDPKTEIAGPGLMIGFRYDDKKERILTLTWTQQAADRPVHLFLDVQCIDKQTGSLTCADAEVEQVRDGFGEAVAQD